MPMHFDARRDELIRTILKSSRLPAFLFISLRRRQYQTFKSRLHEVVVKPVPKE